MLFAESNTELDCRRAMDNQKHAWSCKSFLKPQTVPIIAQELVT